MSIPYEDEMINEEYNFNKYDDMLPFFGIGNNDLRGRLVLSTIMHNWAENDFSVLEIPIKQSNGLNIVDNSTVLGQCGDEYHAFIKKINKDFNPELEICLKTVKELAFDYGEKNRLYQEFKRTFIKEIATIVINNKGDSVDITNDVNKWRRATNIYIKKEQLLKILTADNNLSYKQVSESQINNIDFDCNPDFILQRLYERHTLDAENILKHEQKSFDGQIVARYNKKGENFNKLVNKDGELVGYDSQYYFSLHHDDRCYKTGVGKNCSAYMKKCLLGKEMTNCINFFKKDDFAAALTMELKNTNVLMALDTLKALKFEIKKDHTFLYPESVESWNKNLEEKLYQEFVNNNNGIPPNDAESLEIVRDAEKIKNNRNVQIYIEGMYNIVTNNPALLNKIPDNELYGDAYAFNIKLKKIPELEESYENRLHKLAREKKAQSDHFNTMSGGNGIKQHMNNSYKNTRWLNMDDISVKYNHWLTPEIEILDKITNNKMKKSKQRIFHTDLKIMKKDLRELKDVEKKFYKSQKFKNNYATLLKLYGDRYPNKINLQTMNKWLNTRDKYAKKMNTRQQKVLNTYINLFKQIK